MATQKLNETKQKIKQVNQELNKIQKAKKKLENQLTRQHEREQLKIQKAAARKERNHRIYQWGALVPLVMGVEEFDKISDRFFNKALFCSYILDMKNEIDKIKTVKNKSIENINYFNVLDTELRARADTGEAILRNNNVKDKNDENK